MKVYTVGVGIRGQAPFPQIDPFGRKVYVPMEVDIDEDMLTKIADKTGGKYFRADNTQTLRNIYSEIDRLEKTEAEVKKFQRYTDLFPWLVIPGLAQREPGISRFPGAQLRTCGLVLTHHPGMTAERTTRFRLARPGGFTSSAMTC